MNHAFRLARYKHLFTIGGTHVWQLKGAPSAAPFFFESGLSVDADGAPNAYGPHGVPDTLDNLGNAGHPGNWWGVVTDARGQPIVQNGVAPQARSRQEGAGSCARCSRHKRRRALSLLPGAEHPDYSADRRSGTREIQRCANALRRYNLH